MNLGLYIKRNSPVHALPAGWKLAGLVAFSVLVCTLQGEIWSSAGLLAAICFWSLARLPLRMLIRAVLAVAPIILIIVIFHAWSGSPARAITVGSRILTLVIAASVITHSTRLSDMLDTLMGALKPLSRLGVNPALVSLAIALTIRFIPAIADDYREIRAARMARCGRGFSPTLFGPLLVRMLRDADMIVQAIEARSYASRSSVKQSRP